MQRITGHTNIRINDKADTLAKKRTGLEQIHTSISLNTATTKIIHTSTMEIRLSGWAMGKTEREVFKYTNPLDKSNN
jgi:hypothetical protein